MSIDLWTFFVEQIFGGFWIAIFGLMAIIFLIMAIFGRMNKLSVLGYLLIFGLTMTIGFGFRALTVLIGFVILIWFYMEMRNFVGNWGGG